MSVNFDRIAGRYDETRGGVERGAAVAAVLRAHLPTDGRLLEVGVGTGLVASAMRAGVVGVDISEAMLDVARGRGGLCLARADGVALPFPDRTFAGGYAVWVFHLVADRRAVFAEVRRVLHPGARFVVELTAIPAVEDDDIQTVLDPMYQALVGGPRDTTDEVGAAAAAAGLEVIAVEQRRITLEQSPAELDAAIESRSSSAFWRVTDEQWASAVAPALVALRALPDQDRPRARQMSHATLVLGNTRG